jgi:preprotein translocase subunit SecA
LSEEGSNNCFKKPKISTCRITRDMHKIDEALYFVIEEKNNQVELTDNGIKYLLEIPILTFVLPDIGTEIAAIEKKN